MRKSSSEVLGAASITGKKRLQLPHSSTELTLTDDPDDDLLFSSTFLSAEQTGSPARLLPSEGKTLDRKEHESWHRLRIRKQKRRRSSISLTSFHEQRQQQISPPELPGARIPTAKSTSMSALRTTRRLFATRDSGNVSLSPEDEGQETASLSLVPPSDGHHRSSAMTRLTSGFRGRRLMQLLESAVPVYGRRQSVSSTGSDQREEEEGKEEEMKAESGEKMRTGGESQSSLSASPRKLSYSFDDIDRLLHMTPPRRPKIEKSKKSSASTRLVMHGTTVGGDKERDVEDPADDAMDDEDWEERRSGCPDASSAATNKRKEKQKHPHPRPSLPLTGTRNIRMKKCNSNFEIGSFSCRRDWSRRSSGLFARDGFSGFREEDEQNEPLTSGQMHGMQPHYGHEKGCRDSCIQTSEWREKDGAVNASTSDKSSSSSARHVLRAICSKSVPNPVTQSTSMEGLSADPPVMQSVLFCRLCLEELPESEFRRISSCGCNFCQSCLSLYLTIRIQENLNVANLSCPDAGCPVAAATISHLITSVSMTSNNNNNVIRKKNIRTFSLFRGSFCLLRRSKSTAGLKDEPSSKTTTKSRSPERVPNLISRKEIESLVDEKTFLLYNKILLEMEVEKDPCKTFCPTTNCDNVCLITNQSQVTGGQNGLMSVSSTISSLSAVSPTAATSVLLTSKRFKSRTTGVPVIYCCKCDKRFCGSCRRDYHPDSECAGQSVDDGSEGLLGSETGIKRCPRCGVWIERDEGCAQMMCRKCRHVFCWFCLQSLEDDFLLRHYDRGPCKDRLGHSRASVLWHRTQVVGIFAGFGVLLLLVSPLFLLAAPCLLCCNCFSSCPQSAGHTDVLTPSDSSLHPDDRDLLPFDLV